MHPKEQAKLLGQRLSCPTDNSKALVDCLMNKSAEEIIETQRDIIVSTKWTNVKYKVYGFYKCLRLFDFFYIQDIFHAPEAIYAPSIENPTDKRTGFLTESPTDILRAGKQQKVPFITGINSAEGCYRSPCKLH